MIPLETRMLNLVATPAEALNRQAREVSDQSGGVLAVLSVNELQDFKSWPSNLGGVYDKSGNRCRGRAQAARQSHMDFNLQHQYRQCTFYGCLPDINTTPRARSSHCSSSSLLFNNQATDKQRLYPCERNSRSSIRPVLEMTLHLWP